MQPQRWLGRQRTTLCTGSTRPTPSPDHAPPVRAAARHRASFENRRGTLRGGAQRGGGRGRPPPHARRVRSPIPTVPTTSTTVFVRVPSCFQHNFKYNLPKSKIHRAGLRQ